MFIGLGLIVLLSVSGAAFVAVTAFLVLAIGFLATATMYIILLFFYSIYCLYSSYRRGHRFSSVAEWNTHNADLEGSTARFGLPHDHGSYNSRRKKLPSDL